MQQCPNKVLLQYLYPLTTDHILQTIAQILLFIELSFFVVEVILLRTVTYQIVLLFEDHQLLVILVKEI